MPVPKVSKVKSSSGSGAPSKQLSALAHAKKSKKRKVEAAADSDASDGEAAAAAGGEEAGSKAAVVHGRWGSGGALIYERFLIGVWGSFESTQSTAVVLQPRCRKR